MDSDSEHKSALGGARPPYLGELVHQARTSALQAGGTGFESLILHISRGGEEVSFEAHNLEFAGSNPAPATLNQRILVSLW